MPATKLTSWRLWLCCRPIIVPPSSEDANVNELDELDPHNRFTTSTPPPHPQQTRTPSITGSAPATVETASPKTKAKVAKDGQRPHTVLLPSPPKLKRLPKKPQVKQQTQRKVIRMDSRPELGERWWQVGKRMLERKNVDEKGGSIDRPMLALDRSRTRGAG